jgi:hypothetical protein
MISAECQVLKDLGDKVEACLIVKANLNSDLSSNFADISLINHNHSVHGRRWCSKKGEIIFLNITFAGS